MQEQEDRKEAKGEHPGLRTRIQQALEAYPSKDRLVAKALAYLYCFLQADQLMGKYLGGCESMRWYIEEYSETDLLREVKHLLRLFEYWVVSGLRAQAASLVEACATEPPAIRALAQAIQQRLQCLVLGDYAGEGCPSCKA